MPHLPKYGNWDRLGVANDGSDVLIQLGSKTMRLPWQQAALHARHLQNAIDRARTADPEFQKTIREIANG